MPPSSLDRYDFPDGASPDSTVDPSQAVAVGKRHAGEDSRSPKSLTALSRRRASTWWTNCIGTRATPATGRAAKPTFRVHIVSEAFRGKSRIERHRMVNETLSGELAAGVHALAIHAQTPEESRS